MKFFGLRGLGGHIRRPRKGAWIEIEACDRLQKEAIRRPRKGAWIEIWASVSPVRRATASPPQGGVD